jgi:hypothetical protein
LKFIGGIDGGGQVGTLPALDIGLVRKHLRCHFQDDGLIVDSQHLDCKVFELNHDVCELHSLPYQPKATG